ncbi:hypothetical protein ILUMI_06272 [Ignelater luminosus]|uniref:Glucosidase II subunit alpha n=1 Tax=Ignelater luminosus TaxID=2038154 RepID=A0A8K0GJ91_IGNLU|nr:hypothetical protein ILUMI_06272 [Ignelater luminosus]
MKNKSVLKFQLTVVEDSIFHFLIDEPSSSRYRATETLVRNFLPLTIEANKTDNDVITVTHKQNKALIYRLPFKVEFYNDDYLVSVANSRYKLIFETQKQVLFQTSVVALDVWFPNVKHAYGIPLHADHLTLQNTRSEGNEPYRLYNLDYGNYQVNSTEALHGSIPVLYAHGTRQSSGVFWLNPSQTWVDISTGLNEVNAYFMSEYGALEMFILMGSTLPQTVMQYAKLTGVAPLPPCFAFGYHQSRYSQSQYDVVHASGEFALSDLPLDVVWLDVDYTDGRRYFTWDPRRFPGPHMLVQELEKNFQRIVAIINPHFKSDASYTIDVEAKTKGYYVKTRNGKDYLAESLAGMSSWLDFSNPAARNFYANKYINFSAIGPSRIHICNDMNEPVVFNNFDRLENTLLPDLIHYNGITHGEIHNMYGFYQTMGTRDGMVKSSWNSRPFILTRSHFAGSQRYAAVWTGDNCASWKQLRISLPMCLTEALAGVSFCGADIGGFEGIPDDELYVRWYQAGAWLPFYRGRFAFYAPPREPYLYGKLVKDIIRMALRQRYAHIPLWYGLFREHELTGEPVIRPITYHYPREKEALSMDDEILVGPNVLVAPVLKAKAFNRVVYFPGGESQVWYSINNNYRKYYGVGYQSVSVNLDSIPVFYKGGSIIPRKDRERNSIDLLCSDNYTLYISPDIYGQANGSLYDDSCDGFFYHSNVYLYTEFTFSETTLTSKLDKMGRYSDSVFLERLIILNPPKNVINAQYTSDDTNEVFENIKYHDYENVLEITFGVYSNINLQNEFTIDLKTSNAVSLQLSRWFAVVTLINFMFRKM